MSHVLVVDDEESVCWALQTALTQEGHQVSVASSAEEALELASRQKLNAVILDVRLPGMNGLVALGKLRELTGDAPVIVATAFGNLDTAVRAVEGGAFDYLAKPFDLTQALDAVARALQSRTTSLETRSTDIPGVEGPLPTGSGGQEPSAEDFVGRSPAMQVIFKRIALVAPHDACVLITGESGTGKELVARAIHRYSTRREQPFLPVHIAALNQNLVESELFGHTKGAFTGASQARPGLLALADGGTVFLDEVADIPLPVQVKLLRVLEHNEVLPVGATQALPLNIRVLCATHQDLGRKVAEGQFRHDLFFRLNVFQVHLVPLRERPEDIVPLAEHFLKRFEPKALPLLPQTRRFLESQPWFGNARELRNALEHAAIVARAGPILPEHVPTLACGPADSNPQKQMAEMVRFWLADKLRAGEHSAAPANLYTDLLRCVEPVLLDEVMRRARGNRWLAAKWLGLNRATVRKKLGLYKLTDVHRDQQQGGGGREASSP